MPTRIACFGGIYSNYLALEAAIADAQSRGCQQMFCLGDLGAFGPHPDRVFPILHQHQIACVQGNYDDSIGNSLADCQCGYTDPRDNHFAQLSYDYTLRSTSETNRRFLRTLPVEIRLSVEGRRILLAHGSPRRTNEFLWESTSSDAFLEYLLREYDCEILVVTHTGLPWMRKLGGDRWVINCGALGRPANDGTPRVWYAVLSLETDQPAQVELVPLAYDHHRLADEMRAENLPPEFIKTIETGWWTTCLEILPAKERGRGRF